MGYIVGIVHDGIRALATTLGLYVYATVEKTYIYVCIWVDLGKNPFFLAMQIWGPGIMIPTYLQPPNK